MGKPTIAVSGGLARVTAVMFCELEPLPLDAIRPLLASLKGHHDAAAEWESMTFTSEELGPCDCYWCQLPEVWQLWVVGDDEPAKGGA